MTPQNRYPNSRLFFLNVIYYHYDVYASFQNRRKLKRPDPKDSFEEFLSVCSSSNAMVVDENASEQNQFPAMDDQDFDIHLPDVEAAGEASVVENGARASSTARERSAETEVGKEKGRKSKARGTEKQSETNPGSVLKVQSACFEQI